jgi:hypothetical protein
MALAGQPNKTVNQMSYLAFLQVMETHTLPACRVGSARNHDVCRR